MKKLLLILTLAVVIPAYAQVSKQESRTCSDCGSQCDSTDIPVYIVDGVEVQDINGIASDDIVKVDIIKDPAITKIFSPRLGGIVMITTRSKKILKSVLENYNRLSEEQRQKRISGELLIR